MFEKLISSLLGEFIKRSVLIRIFKFSCVCVPPGPPSARTGYFGVTP